MTRLNIIGVNGDFDPAGDVCYGHHLSTDPECKACIAPVLVGGNVRSFNEVCAATTTGRSLTDVMDPLSDDEVMARILDGKRPAEIVAEMMVEGADPQESFERAWTILRRRVMALRRRGTALAPTLQKATVRREVLHFPENGKGS